MIPAHIRAAFQHADGGTVRQNAPLTIEQQELSQLVQRLQQADSRRRMPQQALRSAPSAHAVAWAESWNLPQDVHAYFEIVEENQTVSHTGGRAA